MKEMHIFSLFEHISFLRFSLPGEVAAVSDKFSSAKRHADAAAGAGISSVVFIDKQTDRAKCVVVF